MEGVTFCDYQSKLRNTTMKIKLLALNLVIKIQMKVEHTLQKSDSQCIFKNYKTETH